MAIFYQVLYTKKVLTSRDRGYAQIIAVTVVYPLVTTDQYIKCPPSGTVIIALQKRAGYDSDQGVKYDIKSSPVSSRSRSSPYEQPSELTLELNWKQVKIFVCN